MNHLLIIGAGGQCRSVISNVQSMNLCMIDGILDVAFAGQKEIIMGIKVIGGLEKLERYRGKGFSLALAIGDNKVREEITCKIPLEDFEVPNIIHRHAQVDPTARLGIGNVIGCYAYIGPEVVTGDFNIVNTASIVEHETHIGNFNHIAPSATLCGRVCIANSTLIGANASVMPGLSLASHTKLAANSTVHRSEMQENVVLAGNPAIKK